MTVENSIRLAGDAGTADFAHGSVFFVGTATVILRYAGFTILTDPNFLHAGDHVHLGYGLTSERLTEPAIDIDELPPIDFVVLSHYHGDHFDRIAEERLAKDLPIVTTKHAADELADKDFTATLPLETWGAVTFEKGAARVRVTAMPGKHGPGIVEAVLPPVNGHMLEFEPADSGEAALRLYITGDTLVHDDLQEIPRRYPEIDLAIFHLGGTQILGLLLTMDAEQGVELIRIVDPREVIPVHYNDYGVFKSPLEDFKRAVADAGFEDRVRYLSHGDTYDFEVAASRGPGPGTAT
jgi:L-ascorbate metabolism protein UlaG (beta-lactamase superfamily)